MIKNFISIFILLISILSFLTPSQAKTIHVATYPLGGNEFHANSDISTEYLKQIAAYHNWQCKFTKTSNLSEALALLNKGDIDVISAVPLNIDLAQKYNYTSLPLGITYDLLITSEYTNLAYEDFKEFNNIQIGCVTPDFYVQKLYTYAKLHGFQPHLVFYPNQTALRKGLTRGKVQAIVINSFSLEKTDRLLGEFGPSPFFCLVRKNDLMLKEELDYALSHMDISEQNSSLFNNYYQEHKLKPYSKEELDYIDKGEPIKVACSSNNKPFSYLVDGKHLSGITISILQYIKDETGLNIQYVVMPEGMNPQTLVTSRQADFAADIPSSTNANNPDLVLSMPYIESNFVLMQQKGQTFSPDLKLKVAINKDSPLAVKFLNAYYPNFTVFEYENTEECLKAVVKGKADLTLQNILVADEYMTRSKFRELMIIPATSAKEYFCLMGSTLVDPRLFSIINKTITYMPDNLIQQYIIGNTVAQKNNLTFKVALEEYGVRLLIAIIILIFILYLFRRIWEQKKQNKLLRKNNEQFLDTIIDLTEQARFLDELTSQKDKYKTTITKSDMIIFDLDFIRETTLFSDKFVEKFGIKIESWEEFIKAIGSKLIHEDDMNEIKNIYEDLLEKETRNYSMNIRLRQADKKYILCELNVALVYKRKQLVKLIGKIIDIDAEAEKLNELEFKSQRDNMTGLYNKGMFKEKVEAVISNQEEYQNCALIFIDLDNFKTLNDTLGHLVGDECLKHTSGLLMTIFNNPDDIIARFGGDEFCIFLHNIDEEFLNSQVNNLSMLMRTSYSEKDENGDPTDVVVNITASIGVYFTSQPNPRYDELLAKGDEAVYAAKNGGKDQFVINVYKEEEQEVPEI